MSNPQSIPVASTEISALDQAPAPPLKQPQANSPDAIERLVHLIAEAADDKKGRDILFIKVGDVSALADYFVIATGLSKVQVRAIADGIEEKVDEVLGRKPLRMAGMTDSTWVLVDYGDVIAHVMMGHERDYYNLEAFWSHAAQIQFEPTVQA
jgi:ribosome-associated protein